MKDEEVYVPSPLTVAWLLVKTADPLHDVSAEG